jgi:leader peptidase (prepilin peptidase) / N-methyltransferase
MDALRVVGAAVLGLLVGSFVTVVVHRVPRDQSVVAPRSRCPACGAPIRTVDNIPVISYLVLRGRCRSCGARVSPEYPLTELATAGLFVGAAVVFEDLFVAAVVAVFVAVMLAVAIIDARWRIVPNRIVYPALVAGLMAILIGQLIGRGVDAGTGLFGLLVYAGPLFLIALVIPHGMGMGDVKLAALIGLVLGSLGLSYVAVAAGVGVVAGGLGALLALAVFRMGRKQQIPFGPFLAGGAMVAALAGPQITDLYLSLLGVG